MQQCNYVEFIPPIHEVASGSGPGNIALGHEEIILLAEHCDFGMYDYSTCFNNHHRSAQSYTTFFDISEHRHDMLTIFEKACQNFNVRVLA